MHTAAKYIVTLLLSVSFQSVQSVGIHGSDFFPHSVSKIAQNLCQLSHNSGYPLLHLSVVVILCSVYVAKESSFKQIFQYYFIWKTKFNFRI